MRCTNVKIVLIIENITGVPHLTKKTKEYFMGAKSEMKLRKLLFLESKIYTRLQKNNYCIIGGLHANYSQSWSGKHKKQLQTLKTIFISWNNCKTPERSPQDLTVSVPPVRLHFPRSDAAEPQAPQTNLIVGPRHHQPRNFLGQSISRCLLFILEAFQPTASEL